MWGLFISTCAKASVYEISPKLQPHSFIFQKTKVYLKTEEDESHKKFDQVNNTQNTSTDQSDKTQKPPFTSQ